MTFLKKNIFFYILPNIFSIQAQQRIKKSDISDTLN